MKSVWKKLEVFMNNLKIRRKLILLYLLCVITPLVITDGVILSILIQTDSEKIRHEMENTADAVSYELSSVFEVLDRIKGNIYTNRKLDAFLKKEYQSNLEFYEESRAILNSIYYDSISGYSGAKLLLYADNNTILNGGHFQRLESVKETDWYREFAASEKKDDLMIAYDESRKLSAINQRRIFVVGRLDYFGKDEQEQLIRIDLDYNSFNRELENMNCNTPVYICSGDRILFSNGKENRYTQPFEQLTGKEKIGYEREWSFYDDELRILVEKPSNMILNCLIRNFPWIIVLVAANILLPLTIMSIINHSFVGRLQILSNAFDEIEPEKMELLSNVRGADEIAGLMKNYNRMLRRLKELIQIVYKDRLERQEMDLARQKAEIQALHSQINPHFLFNVLESIRMHSVLKGEEETSEMIARLAVLERQSVKWTSDYVKVAEELKFIEAYLELQKYRFGKRLSYEIQVMPQCREYVLPRLTILTLVENACVHGIEGKKGNCWIYIRIYEKDGWLYLEIEDTGSGMSEEQTAKLLEQMRNCDIDSVRASDHIGILNACLRLKMISGNTALFDLESEEGAGSWFLFRAPTEKLLGRV